MPSAGEIGGSRREHASTSADRRNHPGALPFGERREVTALCYDLIDSTKLLAHLDLEDFQDVISAFQERTGRAVGAQGGLVRETLGDDGGMAYFGYPVPTEDSATAAIRAGLDIVQACRRLAAQTGQEDLRVRIGIATSEVVVQDPQGGAGATIVGFAPTLASRLQTLAPPDTVVVSERTRRLARRHFAFQHLGTRTLKGLDEEHVIWSVRRRAHIASRFVASGKLSARMVGREAELKSALKRWELAAAGDGQALVVVGEAGIGKSRFMHEILRRTRIQRRRLLLFQCSPRGMDLALAPLVDVVRSAAGVAEGEDLTIAEVAGLMRREGIKDDFVVQTIAFAVGAAVPSEQIVGEASPQRVRARMSSATQRCIEEWSKAGPIVIAVEDVQWIDPTSADLLHDLLGWIAGKPVLLLFTTRKRVAWAEVGTHVGHISLHRLRAGEAGALLADLWPRDKAGPLPPAAVSLSYQRTNGVPLYLEEVCQWLASALSTGRTEWMELLSNARISSFENLLSARLGELGPARKVAQAASVIGREFDTELLRAIVPEIPDDLLSAAFGQLLKANILVVRRHGSQPGYAFRHSLIQETLYGALLRKSRVALHRQLYVTATSRPAGRMLMGAGTLAEHAERAGLFKEAAWNYIEAAKDSSARSAMTEARHPLERTLKILERTSVGDDRERLELAALAALGPVLTSTQGTKSPEACRLYERAVQIARRRPGSEQAGWFPIYWGWWYTGGDFAIQRERAEAVMADLREVADPEVKLQVQHCVWAIDFNMGRHDTCIAAVDAGLALYQAGKGRESVTLYGGHDPRVCGLGQKGLSLWFKGFPKEALASIHEATRWAEELGHVGSVAHAYDIAAMLHRYRRDYAALEDTTAAMRRLARKHELRSLAAKALIFDGWCMASLGDPARGRKSVEDGFAIQREIGTREDFPVYSEMLAEILVRLSDTDSALALLAEAEQEAERTGHLYWLPELCRRRALVGAQLGADASETAALLNRALCVAREQNAATLFLSAYETAVALGVSHQVNPNFRSAVPLVMASVEHGGEMAELLGSISSKTDGGT